jgi:predicted NAD/FAD-binding protein
MTFPAVTLIQFFDNHGMLGINTHPKWKVIAGGSRTYIGPLVEPYRDRILLGQTIRFVRRTPQAAIVAFENRPDMAFDEVVLACHGNQALALLESPTDREREVLGNFRTTRNEVSLHTDSSLLPRTAAGRASWNYNLNLAGSGSATVTYHMNRLQALPAGEDYCVTLNANGAIDPAKVIRRMIYYHPLYTLEAIRAQGRWSEISGQDRIHYCGAYWFYGFHEDGLNSALRVARSLGVIC